MYVAVKGGERAIQNSHKLIAEQRRGGQDVPELTIAQIKAQMRFAVHRVMTEGSLYDQDLAALAIKQACGDLVEAIFLLRAFRTTLPRLAMAEPIDTNRMSIQRRISAIYKDIPGGQVLGPTFDYTHRLLDFQLMAEGASDDIEAEIADEPVDPDTPQVMDILDQENIIEKEIPDQGADEPYDLTRESLSFPAGRDQRLQLPRCGVELECGPRRRLWRLHALEAVGAHSAHCGRGHEARGPGLPRERCRPRDLLPRNRSRCDNR